MPAERRSSRIRERTRTTRDSAPSSTRTVDDNMNNMYVRPQINNDNITITNTASSITMENTSEIHNSDLLNKVQSLSSSVITIP